MGNLNVHLEFLDCFHVDNFLEKEWNHGIRFYGIDGRMFLVSMRWDGAGVFDFYGNLKFLFFFLTCLMRISREPSKKELICTSNTSPYGSLSLSKFSTVNTGFGLTLTRAFKKSQISYLACFAFIITTSILPNYVGNTSCTTASVTAF